MFFLGGIDQSNIFKGIYKRFTAESNSQQYPELHQQYSNWVLAIETYRINTTKII
jgi:hypothetical protein